MELAGLLGMSEGDDPPARRAFLDGAVSAPAGGRFHGLRRRRWLTEEQPNQPQFANWLARAEVDGDDALAGMQDGRRAFGEEGVAQIDCIPPAFFL